MEEVAIAGAESDVKKFGGAQDYSQEFLWARAALEGKRQEKVCGLIEELSAEELDRPGRDGETLLCASIRLGRPLAVALLLARGSNPNAPCADGRLPLETALRQKQEAIALGLIQAGASVSSEEAERSPARIAARFNMTKALKAALDRGADLSSRDEAGNRLLEFAMRYGTEESVRLVASFMDRGAERKAAEALVASWGLSAE